MAGIKRQHNVFAQLGIDPQKAFGYKILEPLIQLRKDGVRKLGEALGLPESIFDRIPFPGPGPAARVIGEVTPAKIALVRKATAIVEEDFPDRRRLPVPGHPPRGSCHGDAGGKRVFGPRSKSAAGTASMPERPPRPGCPARRSKRSPGIIGMPDVVSVTYNITAKPPPRSRRYRNSGVDSGRHSPRLALGSVLSSTHSLTHPRSAGVLLFPRVSTVKPYSTTATTRQAAQKKKAARKAGALSDASR